jgi:phage terminase large subunit-like protein
LGIPRKNGKSGVAAGLALYEADAGPAGGEVYCCAGDREQARVVFRTAKQMVEMDTELASRVKAYKNELVWAETETRLVVVSAESKLKEGLSPTFVVFDEVHVQPDDDLWDVMEQAMGAREEPLMFGITTAGDPTDRFGNDSLCRRLYDHGTKVASGELSDPTFYFAWWEPREGDKADWTDPTVWEETNPGLGDIVSLDDFKAKMARGPEGTVRTKRLNQWVSGRLAAVPAGKWEALEGKAPAKGRAKPVKFGSGLEVPRKSLADAVVFLDGSWSGDSTGVVGCTRDAYQFVVTHHEKTELDGPDWRVPVTSVMEDCRRALDAGARGLLLDPHRWQHPAAELLEEGYPVVEWPTNSIARIVPAWKDFYAAILDGELAHDGNPALARHIANVVLKIDNHGARPVKNSKTSRRHIDLAICAIGAHANRHIDFDDTSEKPRAKMWSAVA